MATKKMLRNGVSEEGMRELFRRGYSAEIICVEHPEPTSGRTNYSGCWNVRAVSPTGEIERVLITQRNESEPKKIKTLFGVVTFLLQMGCDGVNIPFEEGGRRSNRLPQSNSAHE